MWKFSPNRQTLVLALIGLFTVTTTSNRASAADPIKINVDEIRVISWKPPLYHGWPTLMRRHNGELLLAFSGGRESHICPFGRLELMRSKDDGKSWGWPQVIYDSPIDDRDAGIVETKKGTLLLTNFTSLRYAQDLDEAEKVPVGQPKAWEALKLAEWRAAHHRLSPQERQSEQGTWMWRSTDGGVTWSTRYAVPCNSPHGPIALKDGRMIYLGVALWGSERTVGAWESNDDGLTWSLLSPIPARPGDSTKDYHELHGIECSSGKLLAHIRNHNKENEREILQSESTDGGKTWSVPHAIGIWGLPSHLMTLNDGRLLMTYGYRRAPRGNRASVSTDEGKSWSEPIIVSDDSERSDLGYPSTIQSSDGTLVTVWYERLKSSEFAQLRQARWRFLGN